MGKCCVSGAGAINVDYKARTVEIDGVVLKEGDYISINGTKGYVYAGEIPTQPAKLSGNFAELMELCKEYCPPESSYQCRHAAQRTGCPWLRCRRYRSVQYGTHVLRRRKDCSYA